MIKKQLLKQIKDELKYAEASAGEILTELNRLETKTIEGIKSYLLMLKEERK